MWRRAVVVAEGVSQAFRRGILEPLDVSIWNLIKLFLWILLTYSAFAAILHMLSELVT